MRRLSRVEYTRTVADLLPFVDISGAESGFHSGPADGRVAGFENNVGALGANPLLLENYSDNAAWLAERAVRDGRDKLAPCASAADDPGCGASFVATFGRRAFRRPLSPEERQRYGALFEAHRSELGYDAALELTLFAFLQAPQFLYRIENPATPDDFDLASRFSFLIWQSMPDDELLDAAQAGTLRDPAQRAVQVARLLRGGKATATLVDFHRQWLELERVLGQEKDPAAFPGFSAALAAAMVTESEGFVSTVLDAGGGTVAELFSSRALPAAALSDAIGERAGILTRAAFLAGHARSTVGSPPLRGALVLDRVLCRPAPEPPPGADTSTPVAPPGEARSNRQLFAARTAPAICQGCHVHIDGIGFGFEAYDAAGRHRVTDQGQPVDARGEILGAGAIDGPFTGAIELSGRLGTSAVVRECATVHLLRFALGRESTDAEQCFTARMSAAFDRADGNFRGLLAAVALSPEWSAR